MKRDQKLVITTCFLLSSMEVSSLWYVWKTSSKNVYVGIELCLLYCELHGTQECMERNKWERHVINYKALRVFTQS